LTNHSNLISALFGVGVLAFVIAIALEIQVGEPMYSWLALIGALMSICATFAAVIHKP